MDLSRFTLLGKVICLYLDIGKVGLKKVMSNGRALFIFKCTHIHACSYYDLMIELL